MALVLSFTSLFEVLLVSSILVSFVLSWNNSSLTVGNLSNLVTYKLALFLTLVGMLTGFILEGSKMTHSIFGKLIIGQLGIIDITLGALVTLVLFLALTLIKIPVSLTNCVVGAFGGRSWGGTEINGLSLFEITASWILAPSFCMGIAILIYLIIIRFGRSISLPSASWVNRLILFGGVFYVAYALGANNVGMILSFVLHVNVYVESTTQVLEIETATATYFGMAPGTVLFGKAIAKVV